VTRRAAGLFLLLLFGVSCGAPPDSGNSASEPGARAPSQADRVPPPSAAVVTNLETTPLSAADYALYANIMGGASALLADLTPADREALEYARKADTGTVKVTPDREALLAHARQLQHKDEELARLQGIDERYMKVKARVEAVIGPNSKPPAPNDAVATENLRYLEPHRQTIERLQRIVHDPLSRRDQAAPGAVTR
jgi:hypothetical protein